MYRATLPLLFVWMLLGLLPQTIQAQTAQSMTLEEAISYALENSVNVQNAQFDAYIAEARTKEVAASGLPQISGQADAQAFINLPTQILPGALNFVEPGTPAEVKFGLPFQYTVGASVNQLLFDGTFFLGLKAAKVFTDLTDKQLDQTREETAYQVSQAYYQALIINEQQGVLHANIARLQALFNETKALNEAGFVEKIDVDRLQINLNNLLIEQQKTERLAALSKDLLKFQMGMPVGDDIELTTSVEEMQKGDPIAAFDPADFSPLNRIEYSLLQTQRELENLNYRRIRTGYAPGLYAFGNFQWQALRDTGQAFDFGEPWFPITVVGLTLNVPIFDGLRKHRQMQQSQLTLRKIDNQSRLLEQSINLEARQAWTELQNAYGSLEVAEQNRDLANRVFNTTRIKYNEGVGSSLEVNEADTQLRTAQANYYSSLLEFVLAKAAYVRARGEFAQYRQ